MRPYGKSKEGGGVSYLAWIAANNLLGCGIGGGEHYKKISSWLAECSDREMAFKST